MQSRKSPSHISPPVVKNSFQYFEIYFRKCKAKKLLSVFRNIFPQMQSKKTPFSISKYISANAKQKNSFQYFEIYFRKCKAKKLLSVFQNIFPQEQSKKLLSVFRNIFLQMQSKTSPSQTSLLFYRVNQQKLGTLMIMEKSSLRLGI